MTITGKSTSSGTHYWRGWKSGQIWNGSAYEDYLLANYASYDIAAVSEGLDIFTGSVPDDADFAELVYQSGGSPAAGDDVQWVFEAGTAEAPPTPAEIWTYASRTLSPGEGTVVETQQFEQLELVRGNSYDADSRSLTVARRADAVWPTDLNDGWTWTFYADKNDSNKNASAPAAFTGTITVVTATGDDQTFRINLVAADIADAVGPYDYAIRGTKTGSKVWDAVLGTLLVRDSAAE